MVNSLQDEGSESASCLFSFSSLFLLCRIKNEKSCCPVAGNRHNLWILKIKKPGRGDKTQVALGLRVPEGKSGVLQCATKKICKFLVFFLTVF